MRRTVPCQYGLRRKSNDTPDELPTDALVFEWGDPTLPVVGYMGECTRSIVSTDLVGSPELVKPIPCRARRAVLPTAAGTEARADQSCVRDPVGS